MVSYKFKEFHRRVLDGCRLSRAAEEFVETAAYAFMCEVRPAHRGVSQNFHPPLHSMLHILVILSLVDAGVLLERLGLGMNPAYIALAGTRVDRDYQQTTEMRV